MNTTYCCYGIAMSILSLPQQHAVMSYEEYAGVKHSRPYVLEIVQGKGRLIYFGIGHTRDPHDSQLVTAKRLWDELKPQLALNEDRTRASASTFEQSVERDGEPGALAYWAKQDKVEARSLDPSREQEIAALKARFPEPHLKLFYALRSMEQVLRRPDEKRSPETIVQGNLMLAAMRGLKGKPRNPVELDAYWPKLGIKGEWRKPDKFWFDPGLGGAGTPLNKIATASSQFRDQHMIDLLVTELRSGKRVFAMVGASHVVMQERAIRNALPAARIRSRWVAGGDPMPRRRHRGSLVRTAKPLSRFAAQTRGARSGPALFS